MSNSCSRTSFELSMTSLEMKTIEKALQYDGGEKNSFIVDWAVYGARELLEEQKQLLKKMKNFSDHSSEKNLPQIIEHLEGLTKYFKHRPSFLDLPIIKRF